MFRAAKTWAMIMTLAVLSQVTIVCDGPDSDDVEDFFEELFDDLDIDVRVHDHDHGCWYDCEDDWSFDFDWWW